MSTDPSTPSPGQPPSTATTTARAGSGPIARLLTVVYALVVTPVATTLVVYGAMP